MSTKSQLQRRWTVEPGKAIRKRILERVAPHTREALLDATILYSLLEGLPYREEVANGRDFRGSDCVGGRELDFSNTDFSFSVHIGDFLRCNLMRSKFDHSRSDKLSLTGSCMRSCSFLGVKVRGGFLMEIDARDAIFDQAWFSHIRFDDSDLRGASFRGANLKGSCFAGAKLQGCDFRGANMQECVLSRTEVDSGTDFRGANLINAYLDDHYDNAGNLVGKGLDLKKVRIDATTRLGEDQSLIAKDILQTAIVLTERESEPETHRIREAVQQVLLGLRDGYFSDWHDRLTAMIQPSDLEKFDDIMGDAFLHRP